MRSTLVLIVGAAVLMMVGVTVMFMAGESLGTLGSSSEDITSSGCSYQYKQVSEGDAAPSSVSSKCSEPGQMKNVELSVAAQTYICNSKHRNKVFANPAEVCN